MVLAFFSSISLVLDPVPGAAAESYRDADLADRPSGWNVDDHTACVLDADGDRGGDDTDGVGLRPGGDAGAAAAVAVGELAARAAR